MFRVSCLGGRRCQLVLLSGWRSVRTAANKRVKSGAGSVVSKRSGRKSVGPVPGALLKDDSLVEGAQALGQHLDVEGEEGDEDEFMEGVVVTKEVVDVKDEEGEEKFFRSFFGKKEAMIEPSEVDFAELKRKLGPDATVPDTEEQDLREQEQDDPRENIVLKGVRGNVTSKRPGFQQRGEREELQELENNERKQRERQRRVHIDDDRLYVGDVLVPFHLEKWVLDPEGDHKKRHKKQRAKEERLAKWYEEHGMYYERRKQMGFRRDPIEQNLTIRQRRIGVLLKQALEKVFAEDLEHETVPGIMVEDVQVGVDMKRAKVYIFLSFLLFFFVNFAPRCCGTLLSPTRPWTGFFIAWVLRFGCC